MGLVAVTAGLFAVGAYLGRDLSQGWGIVLFIASFGLLIGLNVAAQRSEQLAIGLLFGFGVVIGLATAPTIAYYASTNPQSVWQAGAATALFIAGFGAAGYSLLSGNTFGRVIGYAWAVVVIVQSFLVIQYAPWFGFGTLLLAILVIYALSVSSDWRETPA